MNFHSAEDFLLANALHNRTKSITVQQNSRSSSTELPANIVEGANRGLRIFPVFQTSRFAACKLLKARIGEATSDLDRLAEFAAEDPAGWAFVSGPEAGIFVVEMDGELGANNFNSLVTLGISDLQEEDSCWQTLSAGDGSQRTFAIYKYPSGMALRRYGKQPAPGLTIHGEGSYVLLSPDVAFLDQDASIATCPQLLLDLAFERVSIEVPRQAARSIAPHKSDSRFLTNGSTPGAASRIPGVAWKASTVNINLGWRGKVRISRRS